MPSRGADVQDVFLFLPELQQEYDKQDTRATELVDTLRNTRAFMTFSSAATSLQSALPPKPIIKEGLSYRKQDKVREWEQLAAERRT